MFACGRAGSMRILFVLKTSASATSSRVIDLRFAHGWRNVKSIGRRTAVRYLENVAFVKQAASGKFENVAVLDFIE